MQSVKKFFDMYGRLPSQKEDNGKWISTQRTDKRQLSDKFCSKKLAALNAFAGWEWKGKKNNINVKEAPQKKKKKQTGRK